MRIVVLGATARGNGLTLFKQSLVRELEARGHEVLILHPTERARPERRSKPRPKPTNTRAYRSVADLKSRYLPRVRNADVVIVGSKVPSGADVGRWVTRVAKGVTAFYDSDAPGISSSLNLGSTVNATRALIPKFDLYLTTGGSSDAMKLEKELQPMARRLNPEHAPSYRAAEFERFVAEAMSGQLMA